MAHINNMSGDYTIDGVVIPDPQVPHKFQLNTTGVYYRNMNATREGYLVANMKKLFWKWNRLTLDEAEQILGILYDKLESGSDEFIVTSRVLGRGVVTDRYYLGMPLEFEMETPQTCKMELHFIQVAGKKSI